MAMLLLFFSLTLSSVSNATCWISSDQIKISDTIDTSGYAWGTWNDSISDIGWHQLHIIASSSSTFSDSDKMRCAGAVEGYLSQDAIYDHFIAILKIHDFNTTSPYYPDGWVEYMQSNIDYVNQSIDAYPDVPYWVTIGLIFTQFNGLVEGYALKVNQTGSNQSMTQIDHWILQSEGDLGDSAHVIGRFATGSSGPTVFHSPMDLNDDFTNEHCTGLIKLTKNYSDIFFAHDAWSSYLDMFGTLKDYRLPISSFNAQQIVMSTRPGKLSSYDDYYIADSGLLVLETTMSIFNDDLYEFVGPETLFTWLRAIHATWTSHSGQEWTSTFIKHNSGTYNNQYLVLDGNKFQPGSKPTTDLLWVIEQFPGSNWRSADITERFVNDLFVLSINKPSFSELYDIAGYPGKVTDSGIAGNYWTYETSARYLLIVREAPRLEEFEEFRNFMRYNNWARDLFSNGDSAQMISARADLRSYKNPYGSARASGGMDSKTARLSRAITRLKFTAIASPVHENGNSVWNFTGFGEWKPEGLPDLWDFDTKGWQDFGGQDFAFCKKFTKQEDCENQTWCGWCGFNEDFKNGVCFAGDKDGVFFPELDVCEGRFTVKTELQSYAIPLIATISSIVIVVVVTVLALHIYNRRRQK
jgi:hypothetical protein